MTAPQHKLQADALTRARRIAKLASYDRQTVYDILDTATHCHIAHVIDGQAVATPMLHWRVEDRVYWHGSIASRMMNAAGGTAAAAPQSVCLTATVFDGWVLARSAFNHSANYRAVMVFGEPQSVDDPGEKSQLLERLTEHWFPGRWLTLRPVTRKELAATRLLWLPLTRASAKLRRGGPEDPKRDRNWPVWAGEVPTRSSYGAKVSAAELPRGKLPPVRVRRSGPLAGRR